MNLKDSGARELRRLFAMCGITGVKVSNNRTGTNKGGNGSGSMPGRKGQAMDREFIMPRKATLVTASSLRVWWLVNFRGYRIIQQMEEPRQKSFGRVRFVHQWALEAPPP